MRVAGPEHQRNLHLKQLLVPKFAGVAGVEVVLGVEQIAPLRPAEVLFHFFQVSVFASLGSVPGISAIVLKPLGVVSS